MKNPFNKKKRDAEKEEAFEAILNALTAMSEMDPEKMVMSFVRELIYDSMVPEAPEIAAAFGCPPVSDEVEEMEANQSLARLDRIAEVLPFVSSFTHVIADAFMAYQKTYDPDTNLDSESAQLLHDILRQVSMACATSTISTLVDMGMLEMRGEANV